MKFLSDYEEGDESSITQNTFREIVASLFNIASMSDVWELGMYDSRGHLKSFALETDDQTYVMGYVPVTSAAKGIEEVNRAVTEMDKVVQQVVTYAEESASASEEMSAQAEQMKVFVAELAAMVGQGQPGCRRPPPQRERPDLRQFNTPVLKGGHNEGSREIGFLTSLWLIY